jgi:hypothetical protein
MKTKLLVIAGILLFFAANAYAQGGKAEPNRIKFSKGKLSAVMRGTLSNNQEEEHSRIIRKWNTFSAQKQGSS